MLYPLSYEGVARQPSEGLVESEIEWAGNS